MPQAKFLPLPPPADKIAFTMERAVAGRLGLAHAMLEYCLACAELPSPARNAIAALHEGFSEVEATGHELQRLSPTQLAILAVELRTPTDHEEIRSRAARLVRQHRETLTVLDSFTAALVNRINHRENQEK